MDGLRSPSYFHNPNGWPSSFHSDLIGTPRYFSTVGVTAMMPGPGVTTPFFTPGPLTLKKVLRSSGDWPPWGATSASSIRNTPKTPTVANARKDVEILTYGFYAIVK